MIPRILFLSLTDWLDIQQRPQHLAQRLSQNYNIFYTRPRSLGEGWSFLKYADVSQLKPFINVNKNLFVYAPWTLPFERFSWIRRFNARLYRQGMMFHIKRQDYKPDLIWLTHPDQLEIMGQWGKIPLVYDCMDDFPNFYEEPYRSRLAEREKVLLRRADAVMVSSPKLYDKSRTLNRNVNLIPNGVDTAHFSLAAYQGHEEPQELASLPRPIIGYYGSIAAWFDLEAVTYAAASHPEWSFVLIGPIRGVPKPSLPNVYMLGPRPYLTLPQYLQCFDVALLPFKKHALIDSVDPVKIYEYMAGGKPIVASRLPTISQFKDLIYFYEDELEFVQAIQFCLETIRTDSRKALSLQTAQRNDWQVRVTAVEAVLESLLSNA
jgi:glycosyltransferase involved in cell wall biosynthesis